MDLSTLPRPAQGCGTHYLLPLHLWIGSQETNRSPLKVFLPKELSFLVFITEAPARVDASCLGPRDPCFPSHAGYLWGAAGRETGEVPTPLPGAFPSSVMIWEQSWGH